MFKSMMSDHSSLYINPCGFFIDSDHAFIGASPDALVTCACCGDGVVEVKCPWKAKDAASIEAFVESQDDFYLQKSPSGSLQLNRQHQYFIQCQVHMQVTKRAYCYFVVWHKSGVHVEKIGRDFGLMQENCKKVEEFFRLCVLPELVGKWFTRNSAHEI